MADNRRFYGTGSLDVRTDSNGREAWYGKWRSNGRQVKRKIATKRADGARNGLTRTQAEAELRRLIAETEASPTVGHLLTVGGRSLDAIQPEDVLNLVAVLERRGLRPKSVRNVIGTLSALFNYVKSPQHARVWREAALGRVRNRRSTRSVPMADEVGGESERLFSGSRWQGDDDLVFAHAAAGGPLYEAGILRRFRKALRAAGLDESHRFHDLRHTMWRLGACRCGRCWSGWGTATLRRRSGTPTMRRAPGRRRWSPPHSPGVPIRVASPHRSGSDPGAPIECALIVARS